MAELEKTIKALQNCSVQNDVGCQLCPYFEDRKTYGHEWCTTVMAQDALELLKEQAGTGCWEWIEEDKYRCSECNSTTYVDECMEEPQYLFCPYCGKKMTWAGR